MVAAKTTGISCTAPAATDAFGFIVDVAAADAAPTPGAAAEETISAEARPPSAAPKAATTAAATQVPTTKAIATCSSNSAAAASTDAFGFIVDGAAAAAAVSTPGTQNRRHRDCSVQLERWRKVRADWKRWGATDPRSVTRLKLLVREGVPAALRGQVWPLLCGAERRSAALFTRMAAARIPSDEEDTIARDVGRTFCDHVLFVEELGIGRAALLRVLHAMSAAVPSVQYCQGSGYVASLLLMHMPEEQAFNVLHRLFTGERWMLGALYARGFPLLDALELQTQRLLEARAPAVLRRFEACGFHLKFVLLPWIMPLFLGRSGGARFHFTFAIRLFDSFMVEGWPIMLRAVCALIQMEAEALLRAEGVEGLMQHVQAIGSEMSGVAFESALASVSFSREEKKAMARLAVEAAAMLP